MVRAAFLVLVAVIGSAARDKGPVPPVDDAQKVICKRQLETGSLVEAKRVCHTGGEWQLLGEQEREEGRRLQDQSTRQGTHG